MDELKWFWDEYGGLVIGGLIGLLAGVFFNYYNKKAQDLQPISSDGKKVYKMILPILVAFLLLSIFTGALGLFALIKGAPVMLYVFFIAVCLGFLALYFFYLKSYLIIEGHTLTFHSWRGSTTINWSDIKQARTKWRSAIVLDTTEGTFLFRQGWIGMNDFVEQLFENVPMERIGTKNDFKEILAK